jgi:hypothetical protein
VRPSFYYIILQWNTLKRIFDARDKGKIALICMDAMGFKEWYAIREYLKVPAEKIDDIVKEIFKEC